MLALQEVFVDQAKALTAALGYPTRLRGPAAQTATEFPSGVEIHARLPRAHGRPVVRHHFPERGVWWDRFAAKGVLLAHLAVPGGSVAVATTHLQAHHSPEAVRVRARQVREMRRVFDSQAPGDAAILLGDLNVDGNDPDDPGTDLLRTLFADFQDAAVAADAAHPSWNPRTNPRGKGGRHRYDFVLFRSGRGVTLQLASAGLAMTGKIRGTTFSDHYGVQAEIDVV